MIIFVIVNGGVLLVDDDYIKFSGFIGFIF